MVNSHEIPIYISCRYGRWMQNFITSDEDKELFDKLIVDLVSKI